MKHTPRPWNGKPTATPWKMFNNEITDSKNYTIAITKNCGAEENQVNARLIVRAVNSHEALVEALEDILHKAIHAETAIDIEYGLLRIVEIAEAALAAAKE